MFALMHFTGDECLVLKMYIFLQNVRNMGVARTYIHCRQLVSIPTWATSHLMEGSLLPQACTQGSDIAAPPLSLPQSDRHSVVLLRWSKSVITVQ